MLNINMFRYFKKDEHLFKDIEKIKLVKNFETSSNLHNCKIPKIPTENIFNIYDIYVCMYYSLHKHFFVVFVLE